MTQNENTRAQQKPAGSLGAAEQLQLVLDSAIEYAIFTMDPERRVTSWNEGARRILGYEEAEALGLSGDIIFTPEDIEKGAPDEEHAEALRNGRAEDDRWHVRKDGSRFWARGALMPIKEGGTVQGLVKILRDHTQERLANERLHAALERQEMLTREVSHRVKNSLQIVANLLQLQKRTTHHPEVRHALEDARARVLTVAQIHDKLWRENEVETVDLAGYVGSLCDALKQISPNCLLICEASPVRVPADMAIPLGLLVNELVTNAFKHGCPDGDSEVRVRLTTPEPDTLRLEVSDRGPGLPEGAVSPEANSLGMTLITGLVRQLGGTLEVSSAKPGAHFVIDIPQTSAGA